MLRQSIEADPCKVAPYFLLATNKRFTPEDPDMAFIQHLENKVCPEDKSDEAKCHFTLGKIYDDCREYDQAFAEYQQGNQIKWEDLSEPRQDYEKIADHLIAALDPALVEKAQGYGYGSESPVFVLGMPRSGTTLVESLLCRHPDVSAIGEVPYIANLVLGCEQHIGERLPYPNLLGAFSWDVIENLGKEYVRLSRQYGVNTKRVVDKTPLNFLYVGFIFSILPNARIIHCRRDPVATCLSIYQQYFPKSLPYSYDLEEIGSYYLFYHRLMTQWSKLFPNRILDIEYGELVNDTESHVRRMIKYCGLEWDKRCLGEQDNRYRVRTASIWQARQPVYTSSVQRWRHYEKHLGPLLKVLSPVIGKSECNE